MRLLLLHKGGIGDVVFGLPLIRDLKAGHPGAHLTVLTHDQGKEVLSLCPEVDLALSFGPLSEGFSVAAARAALGGEPFDVALTTTRSPRAAWLLYRSGAKQRVGFGGGPEGLLLTHRAKASPFEVVFSRRFQRLAHALRLPVRDEMPRLVVPEERLETARGQLAALGWDRQRPLVALHVGGGWPTKQWPLERMRDFVGLARGAGAVVLLQGGEGDRQRARALAAGPKGLVLDTVGNPVGEALAQAALCCAAVGLDSGLSHAAAACGVPTVHLFGPNEPASILPAAHQRILTRELPCRPCNRAGKTACPEGHHRCMRDFEAAEVWAAVKAIAGGAL
ncbi:MAG: glycosyltransferase family 9 protein [Myxococcaceae bacterium]